MKNIKLKIFIILSGTLLFTYSIAIAAKSVGGTLPKVQPLQPLNNMVTPNVGHNINFTPEDLAPAPTGDQGIEKAGAVGSEAAQEENPAMQEKAKPQASSVIYIILIIAAAVLFGGLIYKKMAHGKK
jgi:hypothetical protein